MNEELLKELNTLFPNKILRDFSSKITNIRHKISPFVPNGKSLKKFLIEDLGFKEITKGTFDKNIIILLENEYQKNGNYQRKFFQNILNVSKQSIKQKIDKTLESSSTESWEIKELNDIYQLEIDKMIKNNIHFSESKNFCIQIFMNGLDCFVLVFDKNSKRFFCLKNNDSETIKKIKLNNMHLYFSEDFENIKYCNKIQLQNKVQIALEELLNSPNRNRMILEKYIPFLGFEYIHTNNFSSSQIKIILDKYIYPDTSNDIYIPTDFEDAQIIRRTASRNNISTQDFVESYGYKYHRRDGLLRIKRVLKKIEYNEKNIWIPCYGAFYHAICQQAYQEHQLLADFINSLGFKKFEEKPNEIKESDEQYIEKIDSLYKSFIIKRNKQIIENKELLEFIERIEEGLENEVLNDFEREAILKQRIGQSIFREKLIERNCGCKICGTLPKELLIASHIKPWVESESEEKIDIENGFLLCPNHDYLFDKGFISFNDNGLIIISNLLSDEINMVFNVNSSLRIEISNENKKYLKYHRENVLKK